MWRLLFGAVLAFLIAFAATAGEKKPVKPAPKAKKPTVVKKTLAPDQCGMITYRDGGKYMTISQPVIRPMPVARRR